MSGWVLYDGDCGMCTGLARRFAGVLSRTGFALAPLQDEVIRKKLDLPERGLLNEMLVFAPEVGLIGGADALAYLAGRIWWAWPFALAARLPGAMSVLRVAYRWVAARRGCASGRCRLPGDGAPLAWLPLVIVTAAALSLRGAVPPWIFMWTLSVAVYSGFKWWMFRKARSEGVSFTLGSGLGFFFWPGMDARSFASKGSAGPTVEAAAAVLKIALGATLFWGVARRFESPMAAGWCGMIGVVMILHFGIFHLLSLAWRAAGRDAQPLMRSPLLAGSLGDFWGNRWNLAFRQLGYELVFVPFHKKIGGSSATALIFLLSGLIHELVITFPSGGGYGLPTLYFCLQGAGLLLEKSALGRRIGLGRDRLGRSFAVAVAAAPAYWLFPPPFVLRVMIPFMKALGALP